MHLEKACFLMTLRSGQVGRHLILLGIRLAPGAGLGIIAAIWHRKVDPASNRIEIALRELNIVMSFLQQLAQKIAPVPENIPLGRGYGDRPEEQPIVDRMMALRKGSQSGGGMTYEEIGNLLNSEGVPTRRGGRWWATTVRKALRRSRRNRRLAKSLNRKTS